MSIAGFSDATPWARRLAAILDTEHPVRGRWTVTAIGEMTGVSRATLHAILAGSRKTLGVQTLRRLQKLPVAYVAGDPVGGAQSAPGHRTGAPATREAPASSRVTDDLPARAAAELRLMLRGAMMGGAQPDRLLELLDALERALDKERPRRPTA